MRLLGKNKVMNIWGMQMNTFHYFALCVLVGIYAAPIKADTSDVPTVSIEDAIEKGQALMASHYAKLPELQCYISKVEYKKAPDGYWSIFWSGEKNPQSCFSEVRVFNDGKAIFVVGY